MNSAGYPLIKEDYHKSQKLIESIEADPNCEPFLVPVEWQCKFFIILNHLLFLVLGLLDYPTIIKRPMDFDTLKKALLSNKFSTYEEFFADVQLIWDNCKLYNMIGSEIYKLAERMEKMTRREL